MLEPVRASLPVAYFRPPLPRLLLPNRSCRASYLFRSPGDLEEDEEKEVENLPIFHEHPGCLSSKQALYLNV